MTSHDPQHDIATEEQLVPLILPGARLREAREARGLRQEEVAAELRLRPKLVVALEEDDDSSLPPPAFVVGYLRSYARLVNLPEAEVVAAYEARTRASAPELVSRSRDTQVTSKDLPMRLATWVIVAGLVILLSLWWVSNRPHRAAPEATTAGQSADPMSSNSGNGQAVPVAGESVAAPAPTNPADQTTPENPSVNPANPGANWGPNPASTESAPQGQAGQSQPTAGAEASSVESAEQDAAPAQQPTAGSGRLRLVFTADSWTQVTDAGGKKLVYNLIKQGDTLDLSGTPPFKVFLGYAPGVEIYFDGQRIDQTRYQRGDIARFTLGQKEGE